MTEDSEDPWIDLGSNHSAAPTYRHGDGTRYGYFIKHQRLDGETCIGSVTLRGAGHGEAEWDLTSLEPLTLTPSVLCRCGDHGFITDGRWVAA